MEAVAGWVAPIATMIAAMMTAANLGARITGWGFVVFTVGSIGWSIVAVASGQQNLLWTNGFLTLVNGIGIWRWLGRQARYEEGGKTARDRSATARVPTLFPFGAIPGGKLIDVNGEPVGAVVDGMMRCKDATLAYLVVTDGGVGGLGEKLYALAVDEVLFSEEGVKCRLSAAELARRTPLEAGRWPASLAEVSPAPAS